ncbi:MAG: pitrilysin family protein [Calothrix sp. MO_167.B12]|nr:pitrilysin family protein [Calothrix sp. MO_167.B12]
MTSSQQTSTIHRIVLSNGIVLLVTENPTSDIIAGRIFIRAGSCNEKREQAGLAHLLSAVITKGCDGLSSLAIAEQVESLGASLGADASSDYFLLSLKTVSVDFPEILTLAGRILRSPTFPQTEVELEKRIALQDIRSQKERPFSVAFDKLRKAMYPNHPYGISILGEESSLGDLTGADLSRFHQQYFRPDNIVISISGRITSKDAENLVEKVFGDWQIPNTELTTLNSSQIPTVPQQIATPQNTQQSIVMLGYLAASVHSSDYGALKLLSTYLGNGLSSRLFVELREKQGLAYEVSAFYPTRMFPASFVVYMGTAPENTYKALSGLYTEVELLCTTELSAASLQASKNKILGQYALGKQTNAQIAQVYGWYEVMGLGIEFDCQFQESIMEVSVADAIAVANKYLREPYVSLVGQEAPVHSALEQFSTTISP